MQELIENILVDGSLFRFTDDTDVSEFVNKALKKEKEQIMNAVSYGCSDWGSSKDVEKYYNETYK